MNYTFINHFVNIPCKKDVLKMVSIMYTLYTIVERAFLLVSIYNFKTNCAVLCLQNCHMDISFRVMLFSRHNFINLYSTMSMLKSW